MGLTSIMNDPRWPDPLQLNASFRDELDKILMDFDENRQEGSRKQSF
jgi:hypothetical protein